MVRKIILLVEAEHPDGPSARRLIVERLKHHVVTAHSQPEALELLKRVQADVVLIHSQIEGQSCQEMAGAIQQRFPQICVVALTPGGTGLCGSITTIDSLRPQDLVNFLQSPA